VIAVHAGRPLYGSNEKTILELITQLVEISVVCCAPLATQNLLVRYLHSSMTFASEKIPADFKKLLPSRLVLQQHMVLAV
jgi:hypothetical protein